MLRDGQKWVALAMPGYALAGAGAVLTLRRWLRPAAAGLVCCAALVLSLPDLAWGAAGKVEPVRYPSDWTTVAAAINHDPAEVAVLPPDTMRRFAWSGPAPVLDPLPRWLRADVLSTGDLTISGATVLGEGDRARDVQRLLVNGVEPHSFDMRAWDGWWSSWARPATWAWPQGHWTACRRPITGESRAVSGRRRDGRGVGRSAAGPP